MAQALLLERDGPAEHDVDEAGRVFIATITEANRLRDAGEWAGAEAAYATALAVRPTQVGYWVDHGHTLKELRSYDRAEVSYRTALALGVPYRDVIDHLRFVLVGQDLTESSCPIHLPRSRDPAKRPPSLPDIRALARLLWIGHPLDLAEVARLMRACTSLDEVFAVMVVDPRFQQAHSGWLNVASLDDVSEYGESQFQHGARDVVAG